MIKARGEGSKRQREVFSDDEDDLDQPPYEIERVGRVEGSAPPLPPHVDIDDLEAEFGSTADPGWTGERVVPVQFGDRPDEQPIDREEDKRPIPDRFGHLIAALEHLRDHSAFEMEIIPDCGDPSRAMLWNFPEDDGRRPIRWSYLSLDDGTIRRALVARLCKGTKQLYVLESEMRHAKEFHAIGLIRAPGMRPLSAEAIFDILEAAAKWRGVWERLDLACGIEKQVHRDSWTTERFAQILKRRFEGFDDFPDAEQAASVG